MTIALSIVIPTYNREDSLPRVLAKLFSQEALLRDQNAEIVIVDDGSTDHTREIATKFAERFSVPLHYVYQENSGSASARNHGIEESKGDIILFLDSDVIPGDGLVREHVKFHKKYPQYQYAMRGSIKDITAGADDIRKVEVCCPEVTSRNSNETGHPELLGIDFVTGNISVKKSFLTVNGMFDPNMPVLVDPELGYRLAKKGMRIFHSNNAIGYHDHPITYKQKFKSNEKYGRATAIWQKKSPELKQYLLANGRGRGCGFFTWKQPWPMLKHLLSRMITNRLTLQLIIKAGDMACRYSNRLSCWCYSQAAKYFHRMGYRKQIASMKNSVRHD